MSGEQFHGYTEAICGAVVAIDDDNDEVALWISDVSEEESVQIGSIFKHLLKLPVDEMVRFEKHPSKISPLLMIYGLSQINFNCQRVFNLLCLYGDCLKVLFTREGTCKVEMRTEEQAQSVIDHLSGCKPFGKEITFVSMIKKVIEKPSKERLFKMPVGSSCYADFSKSINLRFVNPEDASKIPVQKPTNSLRFYGAPPGMTTSRIRKIFENHAIKPKQSSIQEKNQLCSSGIVIFSTVEEAVKALILCNHAPIVEPYQKNSYIFQLRFA